MHRLWTLAVLLAFAACKRSVPTVSTVSTDSATTGVLIQTGTMMDSPPFEIKPKSITVAIFPADDVNAPAIKVVEPLGGHHKMELPAGRYDLCAGGIDIPSNQQRSAWKDGCKRFDVSAGAETQIWAMDGYFKGTQFRCVSPKASVCD